MSNGEFIKGEIKIRKKFDIELLSELLYYNYKNDDNYNEKYILNALHDNIIYNQTEKEKLLEEAKKKVLEKYNIKL